MSDTTENGKGEYRYHGFDVNGVPYSNFNLENDMDTGADKSKRRWIYQPWNQSMNIKYSLRHDIAEWDDGSSN